jgi:hypothetical protein
MLAMRHVRQQAAALLNCGGTAKRERVRAARACQQQAMAALSRRAPRCMPQDARGHTQRATIAIKHPKR